MVMNWIFHCSSISVVLKTFWSFNAMGILLIFTVWYLDRNDRGHCRLIWYNHTMEKMVLTFFLSLSSLCWLSSIFDVTAIVHLSHYTDALKLTIVFCSYVISPFRLLKNDSRKLSYFVLSFPFPKILPVSYTNLLIHYLFFSNKDLHPPCSISGNFKDLCDVLSLFSAGWTILLAISCSGWSLVGFSTTR
jgi:hypothetical protein